MFLRQIETPGLPDSVLDGNFDEPEGPEGSHLYWSTFLELWIYIVDLDLYSKNVIEIWCIELQDCFCCPSYYS